MPYTEQAVTSRVPILASCIHCAAPMVIGGQHTEDGRNDGVYTATSCACDTPHGAFFRRKHAEHLAGGRAGLR